MSTQIKPAPVRKSIHVAVSPQHAFDTFTNGIGSWWPKSHHIGKSDLDLPVIEPRAGGRWYEVGVDGSECEIGKVLTWEPPARVVLIWQVTPDFTYDPDLVTEVEVRFTPEGDGTRVDLEHRHLERFGDRADTMREQVGGPNGWGHLLQLFSETTTH
jgi:uncharacterized protein YndB with AHSA1/START domain